MSRLKHQKGNGTKLPLALTKELGLQKRRHDGRGKRSRGGSAVADRKRRQRASRTERSRDGKTALGLDDGLDEEQEKLPEEGTDIINAHSSTSNSTRQPNTNTRQRSKAISTQSARSTPLQSPSPSPETSDMDSDRSRLSSPGLVLDSHSTSFRKHARDDDDEIAALERRLGIKGNKKVKLGDDMLDYVLGDLDEEFTTTNHGRDGREWLERKRRKAGEDKETSEDELDNLDETIPSDGESTSDDDGQEDAGALDSDNEGGDFNENDQADSSANESFDGFDSGGSDQEKKSVAPTRIRENPYIAPVDPNMPARKYIPPSLRTRSDGENTNLEQLTRLVQGHLNKLSEANLTSILGEIEKVYRNNARQEVTQILIDRVLTSFCVRSALQKTFTILNAAFLAAVYKVVGPEFGAELLTRLVERFDLEFESFDGGKEAYNLISLLANLFIFGVFSSNMIYDHIRLLLSDFTENNTELLLCIMDACGPQLRSDDPSALKDIVQMMQQVSAEMGEKGQEASVRTKFMMERIVDLKNKKTKTANNVALMTGEHIRRMKTALGSLNSRTLKATDPLRITRNDIANREKVGKWWLVGASWKGNESKLPEEPTVTLEETQNGHDDLDGMEKEVDLLDLARQYRMNTDVKRSIFVAIMSANDCRDAQTRLLKLGLNSKQRQEIAKVLIRCVGAEVTYNPYYAILAKNLCKDNKKVGMGLQFGLWDFFKRMGEGEDDKDSDSEDNESSVELHEIVNVAKMYATLIVQEYLSIGILKTLNIGFLKEHATMFLEILLISIMTQPKATDKQLMKVFAKAAETPQVVKSLQYFIKKTVRKSDLVPEKDRLKVKEGCRVIDATLKTVNSAADGRDDFDATS